MIEFKDIVNKLENFFTKQSKKQKDRSSAWKWLVGLFVGGLALLVVGVLSWRARKMGKELAKLKHEKDVNKQNKIREQVNFNVAKEAKIIKDAVDRIQQLKKRDKELKKKIGELSAELAKEESRIDDIKNWEELDRYLDSMLSGD